MVPTSMMYNSLACPWGRPSSQVTVSKTVSANNMCAHRYPVTCQRALRFIVYRDMVIQLEILRAAFG